MSDQTPMMRQYLEIKSRYKSEILFFRLGDFYEMFLEDAQEVSQLLGLMLTHRHGVPMCGIPYHASGTYIKKLLDHGKKIAICEQITLPGQEKGIVKREVVEVLTPGTVVEDNFLPGKENNFICAFYILNTQIYISVLDSSTGDFRSTEVSSDGIYDHFKKEIRKFSPREIFFPESITESSPILVKWLESLIDSRLTPSPDWLFDQKKSLDILLNHFELGSLRGFLGSKSEANVVPAGFLIDYVKAFTKKPVTHIINWDLYSEQDFVFIDESSILNLELVRNTKNNQSNSSLFEIIDNTKTAAGSRKLKNWLLSPLINKDSIIARQKNVELLVENPGLCQDFRRLLAECLDLERLVARLSLEKISPRDLRSIYNIVFTFQLLYNNYLQYKNSSSISLSEKVLSEVNWVKEYIGSGIKEDPAISWTEGEVICTGLNPELDQLRNLKNHQESILEEYRLNEQNSHGLNSLKLKFNKIIGYYFELTKSQLDKVPEGFIRKQSLVSSERYTTERLEELEKAILGAEERVVDLERSIFIEIRNEIKKRIPDLLEIAHWISEIDVYQSLGYLATKWSYVKPEISESHSLIIKNGRHPVVERFIPNGSFIPNSLEIGADHTFALITGPNMAGKSTYLRQNALIVILAQIGSYIPAEMGIIPIVDKIFCRVGASDNLSRGESTFMVEMTETALILRKATKRSLVIMDEVGRGTSTNDGLAIAWSISEFLLNNLGCMTLFATHFHELTLLKHDLLKNFSMDVEENGDRVVFLRKIIAQASDNSYGLYVAKLAGIPGEVVTRAEEIQKGLLNQEQKEIDTLTSPLFNEKTDQIQLFSENEIFLNAVKSLKLNHTTPIEALNFLFSWQQNLKN